MARLKRLPITPAGPVVSDKPRDLLAPRSKDPRWKLIPGAMTPSLRHLLMAGRPDHSNLAPVRLPIWLDTLMMTEAELEQAWIGHRDELKAEATSAGFVPAGEMWFEAAFEDDVLPADVARAEWSKQFCQRWGY
jgi:hypothetical protein